MRGVPYAAQTRWLGNDRQALIRFETSGSGLTVQARSRASFTGAELVCRTTGGKTSCVGSNVKNIKSPWKETVRPIVLTDLGQGAGQGVRMAQRNSASGIPPAPSNWCGWRKSGASDGNGTLSFRSDGHARHFGSESGVRTACRPHPSGGGYLYSFAAAWWNYAAFAKSRSVVIT